MNVIIANIVYKINRIYEDLRSSISTRMQADGYGGGGATGFRTASAIGGASVG
jgi:hypothetical protein